MDTRQITQILIHKLVMNPMNARIEESNLVAWTTEREKLYEFYNSEKETEGYTDVQEHYGFENKTKNWHKTFKKGGRLEWFNPINNLQEINSYGQGIQTEWVNEDIIPNIESRFLRIR